MRSERQSVVWENPEDCRIRICAVVVTYHPSVRMLENLPNLLSEAQGLVVVDNGSSVDEVMLLRAARETVGFHLIENSNNVGIAEALNQGVRWAKSEGYTWVLLLDQDSRTQGKLVEPMIRTWLCHPKRDRIASVHPRYFHPEFGSRALAPMTSDGPIWCLSSGTLMPTWIFDRIGWFASEFFIDWVDIEYCFRLRQAGYLIAESPEAILLHDPGHSTPSYVLGFRFWPSHHSSMRRYYMSRNRIVVFRKYFFSLPLFTLKAMHIALRDTVKCFLGEEGRLRKFRNFLLGTWDGLIGRMGQREGL